MASVSGTWYWVITTSGSAPTATQIKAGQAHTGSAASASGSRDVRGAGAYTASVLGLLAGTTYWAHSLVENGGIASSESFTTHELLIELTNNAVQSAADVNDPVGTAFVDGDVSGTPAWSLTDDASGKYQIDSSTGEITVAGALTEGVDEIAVSVIGVSPAPNPNPRAFDIIVFDDAAITLHSIWAGDVT